MRESKKKKKIMLRTGGYVACGASVAERLGLLHSKRGETHCKPGKGGCKAMNPQRSLVSGGVSAAPPCWFCEND